LVVTSLLVYTSIRFFFRHRLRRLAMSRFVHQLVGSLLVLGSVSMLAGGCVEAEGRIFVETIYPLNDDKVCTTDPEVIMSRGYVECDDTGCYGGICMLVRNQMTSSLNNASNNNNVETSLVILHSYDLRYISEEADLSEADTTIQITVPAQPEETSQPVFVTFVDGAAGETLSASLGSGESSDLIVGIRFYGRSTGGLEVETPEAFMGVTVVKY